MLSSQITREHKLKANQIVKVINKGDQDVYERFDGHVYHFPPKSWSPVRAEIAWVWFGRPELRDDRSQWQDEVDRISNRIGEKQWEYRKSGNFYCPDFGEAGEFYSMPSTKMNPSVVAQPLDTLEEVAKEFVQAPDAALLEEGLGNELTGNVRIAPRQGRR